MWDGKPLQPWTLSKKQDIECMSILTPSRDGRVSVKRRVFPFAVNINDVQMMGHCAVKLPGVYSPYVLWYEA